MDETTLRMALLPAALAIIQHNSTGDLLLVKRRDLPIWVLPGGGIDPGETASEAVSREVFEETGFKVSILRQSAHYKPINSLAAETFIFCCKIKEGTPTPSNESEEVAFFPLNQLPNHFFSIHQKWLNESLQSRDLISRPLYEVSYKALIKFFILHPWQTLCFAWTRFMKK